MKKYFVSYVMKKIPEEKSTICVMELDEEKANEKLELLMQIYDTVKVLKQKHGNDIFNEMYRMEHEKKVVPLHEKYLEIEGPDECYNIDSLNYEVGQILDEIPKDAFHVEFAF